QTASDLVQELQWIAESSAVREPTSAVNVAPAFQGARGKGVWLTASLALLIGGAAYMLGHWTSHTVEEPMLWTSILPPAKEFGLLPSPAISPDGRAVAFFAPNEAGQTALWVQPLDSRAPREVCITAANAIRDIFWSP